MTDVVEDQLPALASIVTLKALAPFDGASVFDLLTALNAGIEAAGVRFGEYGFSDQTRYLEPEESVATPYRWLECSAVRGGSEGYYVHLRRIRQSSKGDVSATLIGLAKCWSWQEALTIAAVATVLLDQ